MAWNNAGSVAAVAQGNNAFVGTSTLFLGAFIGDTFLYQDGSTAIWLSEITAIADNTHLTTQQNWPYAGLTVANGKWSIQPTSPLRQSTATVNDLLVTLNANFASVYSLTTSDQYGTLNKAASSNNNGHYLTTAGAAVARAGTFGDDAYRISMSKVGGGYNDAIVIDKASALASVFGDPTAALGIATKQYVDAGGGAKKVRAITTVNITISSPGSTIGGVTPAVGERFGLFGQTTAAQCGIYVYVDATHPMTRAPDASTASGMMPGLLVTATEGTFAGVTFVLNTASPIVVGTTTLAFAKLPTLGSNTFTGTQAFNIATFSGLVTASLGMSSGPITFIGVGATNLQASTSSGQTTGNIRHELLNTGGRLFMGLEGSAGGALASGSTAYAAVLGSVGGTPLELITNDTVYVRVKSNGFLQFLAYGAGTLVTDSSGNVTASSDPILKDRTGDFTAGLSEILAVANDPKYMGHYRWNEASGMDRICEYTGFFAYDDFPIEGVVSKAPDQTNTYNERPVIMALINAVASLKSESDNLKIALMATETRLAILQAA